MDVKIILFLIASLSLFSFLFTWCFLKPSRTLNRRKSLIVDSSRQYRNVYVNFLHLALVSLVFNHVHLNQGNLDMTLICLGLGLAAVGNVMRPVNDD